MTDPGEYLILVDEDDHILGHESKETCHQGNGLLHRAFSIFIFNDQHQLLLQKRGAEKPLWPLYWSNSVCSHPRKEETRDEAAGRRLQEELGFTTPLKLLYSFQYQARYKDIGSEHEICAVYIGKANGIVRANHREIAEWKYIDRDELHREILAHPHLYTPWFKKEWMRIQKDYSLEIENW